MATRTVSAAGGNFNATGTWVGGVVPIAGDDIIANATSGNLTLTAASPLLTGINFSGYTRTLALSTFNLNANGTITLGAGMTITATTGRLALGAIGSTLTSNGVTIPTLSWQYNITLVGDVTVSTALGLSPGVAHTLDVTGGNIIFLGPSITINNMKLVSGNKLILRPTSTLSLTIGVNGMNGILQIDTTNAITMVGPMRLDNQVSGNSLEITQTPNFTTNPKLFYTKSTNNVTSIDSGTYSISFAEILFQSNSAATTATLNVNGSAVSVGDLVIEPGGQVSTNATTNAIIQGTHPFSSIKSIYCPSYLGWVSGSTALIQRSSDLRLKGGLTYSVSERLLIGGPGTTRSQFGGLSPSTTNIYFTGFTYSISSAEFTRVNFTSTNVPLNYLNNTNVLVNASATGLSLPSGGGGGGSFTFVN